MKIDITKKYTTRSGMPARIYATDGADIAVHGAYKTEIGWEYAGWTDDGSYHEDGETNDLDLTPAKTWRAWKEGEVPVMFMARKKEGADDYSVRVIRARRRSYEHFFSEFLWVHEDGTETPCGVEE
jgi:hypothetical protein